MHFDRPLFFIQEKYKKMKKRFSMCRNSILKNQKGRRRKMSSQKEKQRNENIWNAFSMRFYSLLTHTLIYLLNERSFGAWCCKTILTFPLMASSLLYLYLYLLLVCSYLTMCVLFNRCCLANVRQICIFFSCFLKIMAINQQRQRRRRWW